MRKGWTYKKLGEVCNIRTGKLNANAMVEDGEYPFFTCDSNPYRIDKYAFDTEAILISGNGSLVGHVNYYKGKFNAYQRTYVLDNFIHFHIPYLLSFLKGYLRPYIKRNFKGGCIPYITLPILQSFLIPLPPKSQQEAIVSELDEINSLLALKREQLQKYDKLAQSLFYEMFGDPIENEKGWEVKKFVDVIKLQRGFDLPTNQRVSSGKIPVYGSNGILGFHDESKINCGIITGRSGTIGEVFVSKTPCWPLNTSLFSADSHGNNLVYLQFLLRAYDLKRFVEGAGVPTLNRNVFHNHLIIDAPLSLQQQFASRIEQIELQKKQVQAAIEKLETLLASRMQYWFD